MNEKNYTIIYRLKNLLVKILCMLGFHILVRDEFIFKGIQFNEKALLRQCMKCKKVINKPNWNYKYSQKIK